MRIGEKGDQQRDRLGVGGGAGWQHVPLPFCICTNRSGNYAHRMLNFPKELQFSLQFALCSSYSQFAVRAAFNVYNILNI